METLGLGIVALVAAWVWWRRVGRLFVAEDDPPPSRMPVVSVVIPARNEAHNLPRLLVSLRSLRPAAAEICVVDDGSTDGTARVARAFGARVLRPPPAPAGWNGKTWACHCGARAARGELLLFTDADTHHAPDSLGRAVARLSAGRADLLSAVVSHRTERIWERLQGVFQLLLVLAAQTGGASYGTGQYLLFRRDAYERIGGHAAVHGMVAEDLGLVRAVRAAGLRYVVWIEPGAVEARMYPEGLGAFMAGWRRNFRDGLRVAGWVGFAEVFVVVWWLLGVPLELARAVVSAAWLPAAALGAAYGATAVAVAWQQRWVGRYPAWSAAVYPLFVVLFLLVTSLSLVDHLLRRPVRWKGRLVVPVTPSGGVPPGCRSPGR